MPLRVLPSITVRPTSRILTRYGQLVVVYLLLIFILPGDKQVMHAHRLSTYEYHMLQLLVGLPLIAIWFMAFYGYAKLAEYTRSIRKTPEAAGYGQLAQGCAWIAWSLPVHTIAKLLFGAVVRATPGLTGVATVLLNYIDVVFAVAAFSLIGLASRHLFDRARIRLSGFSVRVIGLVFLLGGVLYCYLVFRHFSGGLGSTHNPYYLPVWLMVLSVVVPYLYAWFVGMLAVYELVTYGRKVRGLLYRQGVHLLVVGVFVMILGSIASQYSRSIQPAAHSLVSTDMLSAIIFQLISGLGFVLIALGAIRLKKIEEV